MKNGIKIGIIAVVVLALIVGYYFYLSNRTPQTAEEQVELTELDEVLLKQLNTSYPPTPREVVKFYNRILVCLYSGDYTEKQFDGLASQARALMDDELLEENPEGEYKAQLKQEIEEFEEQTIIQTNVCDSDEVIYKQIEGRDCAYVEASYFMKSGKGSFDKTYERYLLRKDDDGNWKILGYHLSNDLGMATD